MIKHIVIWKLKDEALGKTREENARELKSRLEALKDRIPQLRAIEVGLNVKPSDAAGDAVLYSEFDSLDDLAAYADHPAHQEVLEFVRSIVSTRTVVDYEA